jgi:nicotinate-nucleotide adenylyltransferase
MADLGGQRVGILGGAFDPPHLAHLALARSAVEHLQLNELRLVPTGQAWHKPRALTAASHRLAMARLAFANLPGALVDARETQRNGPSYTVDTLREMRTEMPGAAFFLIIGADQARALAAWHAWQEIVQSATICVADRADLSSASDEFDAKVSNQSRFRHIKMPAMNLSATDIRARIAAQQDVTDLVCEPVARYIADHHLYQTV